MTNNKELKPQVIIKKNLGLILGLLVVVIGAVLLALLPPLVLEWLVNQIGNGIAVSGTEAVFYFLILALSGVIDAYREVLITRFGQMITRTLREQMCVKLDGLSASFYTKHATGKIVSLFTGDVDTIQSLFSNGIISMVVDSFQIVSIFIVIFVKSRGLGIMMLIVIPILFLMTRVFQSRMLKAQLSNRAAIAKVTNHIPETLHSIRMIQNLSKQRYMEERYDDYISDSYDALEKSNLYDSIYSPIVILLSSVMIALVMILSSAGGGMRAFFGMSVGTAVAIIAYIGKIFTPIESLGMEIQNIQEAMAGTKRVRTFLSEPEEATRDITLTEHEMQLGKPERKQYAEQDSEQDSEQDLNQDPMIDSVRFEHVKFGYEEDQTVLDDVSFSVRAGENVTLAGRTGCGKSTIFKLILGLYSPDSGEVSVFQKQADRITDRSKRKLFGYVEQHFHRIEGTIADQITLGDAQVTQEQMEKAARLTGLHEIILRFPQQYQEPCTETLLSQGQFQLLSITRAVVHDPAIMLLDEITANLDSATERTVLEALDRAGKDRTVISISHRLYEQSGHSRLIELT